MAEQKKRGGFLRGLGDRLAWGAKGDREFTPAQLIGGIGSRALNMFFPGLGTAANIAGNAYYGAGPLGGVGDYLRRGGTQQIPRDSFSPGPYGVTVPDLGFPGFPGMGGMPGNTGTMPPGLMMPNLDPNLQARENLIAAQLSGNLNAANPQIRDPGMTAQQRFGSGLTGSWNTYGGQQYGQFDPRLVGRVSGHAYGNLGEGRMGGGGGAFSQEQFLNWKAGKTQ